MRQTVWRGSVWIIFCTVLLTGPAWIQPANWSSETLSTPRSAHRRCRSALKVAAAADGQTERSRYPTLNLEAFGERVSQLHSDPPMWLIEDFLTSADCESLILEGQQERLPEVKYQGSVVAFDEERLQTVGLVAPLVAGAGAGIIHADDGTVGALAYAAAVAAVFAITIAGLREVVKQITTKAASAGGKGGARFLGKKWRLPVPAATRNGELIAGGAYKRLIDAIETVCSSANFQTLEPPTLTRYQEGEGQSLHIDSHERPGPDASADACQRHAARGGQRMIQCLVYLNDVDIDAHAGATKFTHESLGELRVRPEAGSVLVFCTSFADGREDARMVHLAEELNGPVEKWVVPVWSCEQEHLGWNKEWPHEFSVDQEMPV